MSCDVRTGIGWDSHRLVEGRPLVLGGVLVEHDLGLAGHSDADVLTHAVIDALLGAAGLDDIGAHFPDSDPRWKDADSIELLAAAAALVSGRGLRVCNVDSTIVMERPKVGPLRVEMGSRIAAALEVEPGLVNVKATTGEGMGFVGREEGVAAMAVVTLCAC